MRGGAAMVEVIDPGARIPYLTQKTTVTDVDVHEGLRSLHALAPYLDNPWRSPVGPADVFKTTGTFSYSTPQEIGVATTNVVDEDGAPAGFDHELRDNQLFGAYEVECAILISAFRPADFWVQPEFVTTVAYNDQLLKNRPKRSLRKTCHPAYTTSDHSRCTVC
jgi:uncharacterized protein